MAFQGNLHLLPKSDFLLIEEEMKKLSLGADYDPNSAPPIGETARRKKGGSRRGRNRDSSSRAKPQEGAANAPAKPRGQSRRPPALSRSSPDN